MSNFEHDHWQSADSDDMNNQFERFELLSAYLDGEVTAEERQQVQQWLDTDPQFHQLYVQLSRLQREIPTVPVPQSSVLPQQLSERVFETVDRQACRGAAALHRHDHQRQLQADGEPDGLALERDARPGRGGHAERPAERRPERGPDAGNLVLGLERAHAHPLVLAQLVQDVTRRGDRVRAEEQGQPRLAGGGNQAVGEREVAGDRPVGARVWVERLDGVAGRELLSRLTEVPPGPQRGDVGVADGRVRDELGAQEVLGELHRTVVQPRDEPEREHVLRPR